MKKIILSLFFMSVISMTAFAGENGGGGGAVAEEAGLYPGMVKFIVQHVIPGNQDPDFEAWAYAVVDLSDIATLAELFEVLRNTQFISGLREAFSFPPNYLFEFHKLDENGEDELVDGDWSSLLTFPRSSKVSRLFRGDFPVVKICENHPPKQVAPEKNPQEHDWIFGDDDFEG